MKVAKLMTLFEELERVKLQLIAVCEALVDQDKLTETHFEEILNLLDSLDEHDQVYINQKLNELTNGRLDLMFWEKDGVHGS